MTRREYSAGLVKLMFWFQEFRKFSELMESGKDPAEIRELSKSNNIFAAPTPARADQTYLTVLARIKAMPENILNLFPSLDLSNQKLVNLIAIMSVDSLFFDFVYEVIREKLIIGDYTLSDIDVRVFFNNKQVQSEKVAGWQGYTLVRLGACYKTLLLEAGLLEKKTGNEWIINRPFVDFNLENRLKESGLDVYLNAITGAK